MTTEAQVIERVTRAWKAEVGYASRYDPRRPRSAKPAQWSKYDQNGWHGYWCVRGLSTVTMQTIGIDATNAAYGRQRGMTAGWAATWLWQDWFQQNRPYHGVDECQAGDIGLMRFGNPSGNRGGNPTNHGEGILGPWRAGWHAVGFNTVGTSGSGNPGEGATVSLQWRQGTAIVGAYRPDWAAAAKSANGGNTALPIKFTPVGRTTKQVQAIVGVKQDGDYGTKTRKAVKDHQQYLTSLGYKPGTADGLWGRLVNRAQEAYMSELSEINDRLGRLERAVTGDLTKAEQAGIATGVESWSVFGLVKTLAGRERATNLSTQTALSDMPRAVWGYVNEAITDRQAYSHLVGIEGTQVETKDQITAIAAQIEQVAKTAVDGPALAAALTPAVVDAINKADTATTANATVTELGKRLSHPLKEGV